MKKIILALFALCVTIGANAQISYFGDSKSVGNGMLHSKVSLSSAEHTKYAKNEIWDWKKATLSYVSASIGEKSLDFGLSASYYKAFRIDSKLPIFLEYGGVLSYASYGTDGTYTKVTTNAVDGEKGDTITTTTTETLASKDTETYVDIKIPVNVVYRLNFGGDFSLLPYVGLNLKCGVIGSLRKVAGDDKESYNMYDKDKVGEDAKLNRVNLGMQYGVNLVYKHVTLGIGGENDFTKTCTNSKYGSLVISAGYWF